MTHNEDFALSLSKILEPVNIKKDELMSKHTSFKVGGPVDYLVTPNTFDEVIKIINLCKEFSIPYYIFGNGSNLLVKDGGIRGVVIKLSKLSKIELDGECIVAECGATLFSVSRFALDNSLAGFEFASGIPGSVGGAIAMNAGAYGGEMCHVVEEALVIDEKGELKRLNLEELELNYRSSSVLTKGYIALEVKFRLKKGEREAIKNRIDELTRKRLEKQPLEYASAGSTFKRPTGYYTGKLIEDCGLKGVNVGDAEVSKKHSGFIINKGHASASDILKLIKYVQNQVKSKYDVELSTEVRIIGEDLSK